MSYDPITPMGAFHRTNDVINRGYIYNSVDQPALSTFVNQQNATNDIFRTKVNLLSAGLNQAHERADVFEGEIRTLKTDRDDLQGRATALETRATTLENDRAALQGRARALENRATTLETDRDALQNQVSNLEKDTEANLNTVTKNLKKEFIQTNINLREDYKQTRSDYEFMRNENVKTLDQHLELSKLVGTHTAEITSINTNLQNYNVAIKETKEDLQKHASLIDSHTRLLIDDQKYIGKHEAEIAQVVKSMDGNESKVGRHEQKLSKVREQIATFEGKIDVINTKLDPLSNFYHRISENLTKLELDIRDTVREGSKESKIFLENMGNIYSQVLEVKKNVLETEEKMRSFSEIAERVDSLKREINELRTNNITQSSLIQELQLVKSQQEQDQKMIGIFTRYIMANAKSIDLSANAELIEELATISDLGRSTLGQSAISK